jgi:putative ABC transport system permease protein
MRDMAPGRTIQDVLALRESAPLIRLVSPQMGLERVLVSRGGKFYRPADVSGVWGSVLEMNLYELQYGRFFTDVDEERAHPVCVIGTGVRDELFGSPQEVGREIIPIGEEIRINDQPFTIVGMFKHYESEMDRKLRLEAAAATTTTNAASGPTRQRGWGKKGWNAFWRKNNVVYTPLNTMWVRFRASYGTNNVPDPTLSNIDIKVSSLEQLDSALQQARNVMLVRHQGIEDFNFRTQENQIEDINKRIQNMRLSGGIIAGLSLLVGGIGIMNIMLASINERIREIGICKAIGATGPAIFTQILVESVVISILGGFLGLGASQALVLILGEISPTQNSPVIQTDIMVIAVLFSAVVGVAAGIIPALKAARLNPIGALRYE